MNTRLRADEPARSSRPPASYDGAAATPMTPADDHLRGRTAQTQVGPGYAHPDVDAADITWRAPATGTLHVEGEVSDADPTCGDGALVVITAQSLKAQATSSRHCRSVLARV